MTRAGMFRPVVFPMKNDLREDIVLGVLRTMQRSKKELLAFLSPAKSSSGLAVNATDDLTEN